MGDESKKPDRKERLHAALRENLKRRKAQARARAAKPAENAGETDRPERPRSGPKS